MPARLLDGATLAKTIRTELQPRVASVTARLGRPPGLGIVLVGHHPASEVYVRNKLRAAAEIGIRADLERLPATATIGDTLALVERLNGSPAHDAILVQAPLPPAMGGGAAQLVFDAIDPLKDVDGFSAKNVGRLVQKRDAPVACTPRGVIELLDRFQIPIAGARAVIIGRSDIVGKPLALLLLHRDATVTICHSKTRDLASVAASADLLIAAIGRPALVTREFVRPGATVIDVGMNTVTDPALVRSLFSEDDPRRGSFDRRGSILVGDVHPEVASVAGALTPVPGGVGPMTIAMLLSNTVRSAEGEWRLD
ncbi:MAG: bifunctional 5,10-methylenetetrahydrofolate dehydrogenase/5,10-methenyltetrahydrofolate cyclohydrolase [Acidobacteria bacterium]|nr:bifunctional 5,10-methylenetetrahydrofolate dehydrogenase/5,10-methenyltetrahydrofolate cyclohydrolase [Acidobacteriota bacterium]